MKKTFTLGVLTLVGLVAIGSLTGCVCTRLKKLSGPDFEKEAQKCSDMSDITWTYYIGASHQRAYLEHCLFLGKANVTTIYWTPLTELRTNLVTQLKTGGRPWTNWSDRTKQP